MTTSSALLTNFALTVPGTDTPLTHDGAQLVAPGHTFGRTSADIWDLVAPARREALDCFAVDYAAVRTAEQRELTPDEVRALPELRHDHPLAAMWQQRAASYKRFRAALSSTTPGHAIDIGAGCAWLAADLARSGWQAAAIDVTVEGGDGLSAAQHHDAELLLLRAEMQALPLATNSVDLAVFNASLHYAANVAGALHEAARVLRPGAKLVVLDSPVFASSDAGQTMVAEFDQHIASTYGIAPAALEGPGFVSESDIEPFDFARVGESDGLRTKFHQWRGARRAGREVASRPLLVATIGDRS